ncbi:MAG TPA: RNA polymerase sigma factor [Anaeromyxobacteraceae bacterium]|nr:RNA polymerase sigma factor [Anaeromyxobacteraceae bacterium]
MSSLLTWGQRMVVESVERTRADLAMERYADGDDSAFGVLYDELAPRLHRFALRETRSAIASEDAVQQTLLQIHCARSRFVRGATVLPWAYAIVRRLLIDGHRRAARDARLAAETGPGSPDGAAAPDEALDLRRREAQLERDLHALPERQREAFCLVKLEGLSVADAAQVLGTTPGNVKIRTHRAVEALRLADARRQVIP